MVKQIFPFSKECEVALGILETVVNIRFRLAPARAEPVEKLAESCALTSPRRKESEGKNGATTVVTGKALEEVHLRNDEGNFPFVPDRLDIRSSISVLTIFSRRRNLCHCDYASRLFHAFKFRSSRIQIFAIVTGFWSTSSKDRHFCGIVGARMGEHFRYR